MAESGKDDKKVLLLNRGKRLFETKNGNLLPSGHLAVSEKEAKALLVYDEIIKVSEYVEPKNLRALKADLKKSETENKELKKQLAAAGGPDPDMEAKIKEKAEEEAKEKAKLEAEKKKKSGGGSRK